MPNNKYDYTVKIGADISNLKKDIKSELASVLREVDNVGDAVSKGITPDTKEFESKIASLESKMEKLAQNSKDVEQQVSSMKTAFKGFTELEASMKAIGEQNKEMYETFIKMTPYLQEFAKTFTAMKPEQAGAAFASTFKDAQNSAQQAADVTKKTFHEVETAAVNGAKVVNGAVETTGQSINNITQNTKEAVKELERLQGIRKKYGSDKSYSGKDGQKDLRQEISKLGTAYTEQQRIFEETDSSAANYGEELTKLIEKGQQLLALTDKLNAQAKDNLFDTMGIDASEINDDIDEYLKLYQKKINSATTQIGKIELKPLKLKVDISTDDELISQINKAIERIQSNTKINPLKIPLDFIDVGEEEVKKNNKKKKKTKNVKVDTENDRQQEVEVDSRLKSVVKEIESLQKSFDKIKTPLLNDIKQWRNNLEEYLTLQFKWKKVSEEGDEEGISALFNDINHYAEKHPIWLNPDTNKLISEIENDLSQHQFKLDLSGSGLKLSGNVSGAVPVAIVGGGNAYQNPTVQRTIKQGVSPTSSTTVKSETKKDTSSVDKNSKVVEKNSDVISDVINEFKTYSQKTNETIARANKTIERLTAQNEKLDKNKPEDAEKIAENQRLIKKAQDKKDTAQSRMSALSSVTGIDIQNINNIDNDTLVATITSLVQDRNEIVDVISTTKIGGASNSKNFLTKAIRDIVDSIKAAQEALGVEVKDADTVSKEIAAKDYLKDAEQLTRMGMALKTANREIRNNIVPTEESLQQVVDVFGGRGLISVTQSAQNLKNVLEQYHDVFESDGGYQEYITRLNDEITQLQSEIDELSKHPRKNKAAIAEKKGQLGVKQFELEDIQSNVEPVLNIFKESIKGLPGQIAELLKGYKFIVEFVDADGKKVTESFNDASARAPRDTEPYYKRSAKMFDRINAGEVTSITPKSTPNDSVFSVLYGDKISKSTAIQQIIDAYNQLDKKAQLFVNSLIDIKKLTDENISLSEKWALIENSGIIDRNNRGQAGRSINVNKAIGIEDLIASKKKIISNKSKIQSLDPEKDKDKIADLTKENKSLLKNIANIKAANREIDSFIDTIVGAYFGVNSNAKLKAGQQKMLMRGTPISYGSSKNAIVAHPEERKYEYGTSNRTYRAIPNYEQKTIEQLNAELEENKINTDAVNTELVAYKESLAKAQEAHQKEYDKKLSESDYSPEKLRKKQEQFTNVKSYDDFVSAQGALEKNVNSTKESKSQIEKQNQQNDNAVKDLSKAIKSREESIKQLKELVELFSKKSSDSVSKTLGKIDDKGLKDKAYSLGVQTLKNGQVKNLTRNEYKSKIEEELLKLESEQAQDKQKLVVAQDKLEASTRELEVTTNNASDAESKLKDLREGFATEYVQYLQNLIDNIRREEGTLNSSTATTEEKEKAQSLRFKAAELVNERTKYTSIANPEIKTGFEGQISQLESSIKNAESKLGNLETEKKKIEEKISDIANGKAPVSKTPVKSGSEEAKTYARREIEAIEEDLKIADSKIKAAEDKKKDFDDRIKVLKKKGEAASEVKESQAQATGYAVQTAKNTDDYKEFQKNLHQQFEEGSITWDEYSEKIQTKIDEIVNKLKEAEPEKYTGKSAEELTASLNKEKQAQQDIINEAKTYKKELQAQRQEAMAFAQITEEELANQRAITEEKKEQVQVTQQEKTVQVDQVVESRIQEQSNQVDTARVQELDNKMSAIDEEIAQLRAEIKSESKKKKTTTSTKRLTDKQQAKVDEQFLGYVSQIKAKEINKKVNVKDIDLSEAINMQKQLNALAEQGNQNTEEYLTLQRQLSELISKRTNQLKGTGRNGYATHDEKYDWLKNNFGGNSSKISNKSGLDIAKEFYAKRGSRSEDSLNAFAQNTIEKLLAHTFGTNKLKFMGSKDDWNTLDLNHVLPQYQAYDEILQQIGYHLGEIKPAMFSDSKGEHQWGFTADAVANSDHVVTNLEEARNILLGLEKQLDNKNSQDTTQGVADFYNSDEYIAQNTKFVDTVASKLGTSLVDGFSDEFKIQCVEAAKQAYNNVKAQGGTEKDAKKAAMSVVQKLLDSVEQGVVEGVKEEVADSSSDVAGKKARIKELTAQKKQYQTEKDQLITTAQSTSTAAPLPVDEVALQAGTVIVSGGSDGTGPWALETTLQRTNEILNSISGKIDSVKGSSGSSNDSPASGSRKKKKKEEEIDVNAIRQRLESEAADNRKRFSIDGLEDSIKSVQKFDEKTLKLYETFTLANGEAVKFTYSLNTMDGTIKSSYTTIANFEGVAKKAYTELGKSQIATKQLFEGFNFPQDKITAYNNAIAALNNKLKGLGENGITDPKDANEVEVLTGNVKKLRTEIENMVKASEKTANSGTLVKKFNAGEVDNVKASMKALAEEIPNASLAASNFNDKTNELIFTVKTGRNELTTLTYKFDELTQSVYETGRASKTTTGFFKSFFSDVGTKIAELARYYTGMSLLTEGLQQVRRGVQYVREIDLALTELKKVTDETENAYRKFLQTASQTSKVIGSTVADFTNATADFARLGYTISEAAKLAEASSIYKNVGDGIESVADASESIISTMKAFGIEAEDAMGIVDRFNEVGKYIAQIV